MRSKQPKHRRKVPEYTAKICTKSEAFLRLTSCELLLKACANKCLLDTEAAMQQVKIAMRKVFELVGRLKLKKKRKTRLLSGTTALKSLTVCYQRSERRHMRARRSASRALKKRPSSLASFVSEADACSPGALLQSVAATAARARFFAS